MTAEDVPVSAETLEPNVVVEAGITRRGDGWAQLQALWAHPPREGLCFDYALPPELKEPCRCGTRSCRGWIVERCPRPTRARR